MREALLFLAASSILAGQTALLPAPGLVYSTYLRNGFTPAAVATDSGGNVYLAGSVIVDPATSQTAAMILKLNPKGTQYLYVRTLGGTSNDAASAIAVDGAGNAYITGTAASPDFPVTPGRQLASAPSSPSSLRTFLVKLDPQGSVLFSELLGASSFNMGQAVAVTAQGEIVVSGIATPDFPVTAGAYAASGTETRPYLMKLDATGATVRFAAFGIGGNALAIDAAGNIYIAGATTLLDYPTTPGVYQPVFKLVTICFGFCRILFAGTNQYLTKVDAAGSKLIYSTAVGGGGQTTNTGLAVDGAGNAYLTGLAYGSYPYTVKDPGIPQVRPFLTKIDSAGQNALYSIPIGGAGVALDASGHVFAGGSYNNLNLSAGVLFFPIPLPPPPTASLNAVSQCLLNGMTTVSQAYVTQVDAGTGNPQATVLIDGSNLSAAGIALAGKAVWIAGFTTRIDVPISSGAINDAGPNLGFFPGAYLGMADFSLVEQPGVPHVACILDSAGLSRPGAVAVGQLLSLFGTNLGPAQGLAASDTATTSLAGVTVTFDGTPGKLLYVSQSQINVAVPVPAPGPGGVIALTSVQVAVNGLSAPRRELPIVQMSPNLFAVTPSTLGCPATSVTIFPGTMVPLAQNQDGTLNSCDHPAKAGSVVSFFVDGLGGVVTASGDFIPTFPPAIPAVAQVGNRSAEVVNIALINDFVWRIDVRVPADVVNGAVTLAGVNMSIDLQSGEVPVGPRGGFSQSGPAGGPLASLIWVGP